MEMLGTIPVYETLPAFSVDLDKECVCSWPVAEEEVAWDLLSDGERLIDTMIDGGTVYVLGISELAWAKSAPDEHGFCDVLVDAPKITRSILWALYNAGIIGKTPSCVNAPACQSEGTTVCQGCHNEDSFYPA
jgi:hypothetical protein